jgi:hypothetical protein
MKQGLGEGTPIGYLPEIARTALGDGWTSSAPRPCARPRGSSPSGFTSIRASSVAVFVQATTAPGQVGGFGAGPRPRRGGITGHLITVDDPGDRHRRSSVPTTSTCRPGVSSVWTSWRGRRGAPHSG